MSSNLHLIVGGSHSGKSGFVNSVMHFFRSTQLYGSAHKQIDALLKDRVAALAVERPTHCVTTEAPQSVHAWITHAISQNPDLMVFDCVTLWLAAQVTETFKRYSTEQLYRHLQKEWDLILKALKSSPVPIVVLFTDVSAGVVPPHLSARVFRDLASLFATQVAVHAETVVQMTVGQPLLMRDNAQSDEAPFPLTRISHHWYARRLSRQS